MNQNIAFSALMYNLPNALNAIDAVEVNVCLDTNKVTKHLIHASPLLQLTLPFARECACPGNSISLMLKRAFLFMLTLISNTCTIPVQ